MTTLYILLLLALALFAPAAIILLSRYIVLRHKNRDETSALRQELASMRKNAGYAAQVSRTQYDKNDMLVQAMRRSPIYVFVKEVTETTSRILASSENYKHLPGHRGAGVTGRIMEELFPPDFAAQTVANDRAVLAGDKAQMMEEELEGQTFITTKFPIVSNGRRLLAGFTIDITERKLAETERELLMRAIEAASETVVITDPEGSIVYVNPTFSAVTGYTRDEALAQNPRILKSGVHDANFYNKLWATILNGDTWSGQIVNKNKNGALFTEQATISPIFDNNGNIANFVAVKRDITEQIRIAQENALLQEQLAQAQKMESVGRLAGGIAHDFNNMLQAIMGYTDMALESTEPNTNVHDDLIEIKKASEQAATLTRQLQTFARKEAVTRKIIDVNSTIDEMLTMLRRLIGTDVNLHWTPGDNIANVDLDSGHFNQIVVNMVVNARDAVEPGGVISLSTSTTHIAESPEHEITPGCYVCLSVHDNGSGIDQNIIGHIFDPFFTTKPLGQGTGLGLSVVYGIVKQAGGTIQVTSNENKGTLFEIYFPASKEDKEETVASENGTLCTTKGETVLLVDDEAAVLKMTQRLLESAGYKVIATTTATEALTIFEADPQTIDIVVSDVVMPEISGPEMIKRMLIIKPPLKHLFISGHTANLLENVGLANDKINCIQKPFSAAVLIQKISECLDSHD